jgi:hypothetical protein
MRKYVFEFSIEFLYLGVITYIAIAVASNVEKNIGPGHVCGLVAAIATGAGLRKATPLKDVWRRFLFCPRIAALAVIAVYYSLLVAYRPLSALLFGSISIVIIASMLRLATEEKRRHSVVR